MTWPVGRTDPVCRAFFRRSSTGSMPRAAASLSICPSWAKQTCTAPNPRIAPAGGLFVKTAVPSIRALGTSYGPAAKVEAFRITAGDEEVYAPPSMSEPHVRVHQVPSRRAPVRAQIRAGWRCT